MTKETRTLHSNPRKLEKEKSFLATFLLMREDLLIEKYERGESPDYILFIQQERIGLEVTSLVHDKFAAIRTAQDQCLKKSAELAKHKGLPIIEVQVKFRSDHKQIETDAAATELVQFIENKISEIDDKKSWHYHDINLIYIDRITIRLGTMNGCKWLADYRFNRIHSNWMRQDPILEIQQIIDKKQSKLCEYANKCKECWLLIGVNEWTAPEAVIITQRTKDHDFSGGFTRLFFLENIKRNLVELQIHN